MANKQFFVLTNELVKRLAIEAIQKAQYGFTVLVAEPGRSQEQNRLLWPLLTCFSQQLMWPVNGQMVELTADEWKDILTAAFENEVNPRVAMGLNGGMVMLGRRTSKYSKKKFTEFIEFIYAIGADRGVRFDDEVRMPEEEGVPA